MFPRVFLRPSKLNILVWATSMWVVSRQSPPNCCCCFHLPFLWLDCVFFFHLPFFFIIRCHPPNHLLLSKYYIHVAGVGSYFLPFLSADGYGVTSSTLHSNAIKLTMKRNVIDVAKEFPNYFSRIFPVSVSFRLAYSSVSQLRVLICRWSATVFFLI